MAIVHFCPGETWHGSPCIKGLGNGGSATDKHPPAIKTLVNSYSYLTEDDATAEGSLCSIEDPFLHGGRAYDTVDLKPIRRSGPGGDAVDIRVTGVSSRCPPVHDHSVIHESSKKGCDPKFLVKATPISAAGASLAVSRITSLSALSGVETSRVAPKASTVISTLCRPRRSRLT